MKPSIHVDLAWLPKIPGLHATAENTVRDVQTIQAEVKYNLEKSNTKYKAVDDKHRRNKSQNQQRTPSKHHMQPMPHQPQYHPIHQQQSIHQSQHAAPFSQNHQCGPSSHLPEMSQHMACLQPLTGGRLHVLPTSPAKFCDECGAQYLRETSKFCSECGVRRLGT